MQHSSRNVFWRAESFIDISICWRDIILDCDFITWWHIWWAWNRQNCLISRNWSVRRRWCCCHIISQCICSYSRMSYIRCLLLIGGIFRTRLGWRGCIQCQTARTDFVKKNENCHKDENCANKSSWEDDFNLFFGLWGIFGFSYDHFVYLFVSCVFIWILVFVYMFIEKIFHFYMKKIGTQSMWRQRAWLQLIWLVVWWPTKTSKWVKPDLTWLP